MSDHILTDEEIEAVMLEHQRITIFEHQKQHMARAIEAAIMKKLTTGKCFVKDVWYYLGGMYVRKEHAEAEARCRERKAVAHFRDWMDKSDPDWVRQTLPKGAFINWLDTFYPPLPTPAPAQEPTMTEAAAPFPITAQQADDACGLIERHCPAADATTDVQVALGRLSLWIRTNGQYPRPAPAKEPGSVWLIERGQREHQSPTMYFTDKAESYWWTPDVQLAYHYESKENAEAVIRDRLTEPFGPSSAHAAEHLWLDRSIPPFAPAPATESEALENRVELCEMTLRVDKRWLSTLEARVRALEGK